jgi:hypothetical protein
MIVEAPFYFALHRKIHAKELKNKSSRGSERKSGGFLFGRSTFCDEG